MFNFKHWINLNLSVLTKRRECAKLRTSRAYVRYVLTCLTCLRVFVPVLLTCLPFLLVLRTFFFYVLYVSSFFMYFTSPHFFYASYVPLYFYVSFVPSFFTYLTCLHFFTCLQFIYVYANKIHTQTNENLFTFIIYFHFYKTRVIFFMSCSLFETENINYF